MIVELDTENGDYNLTSSVAVLTHTPDASNPMLCQAVIYFGDGSKDLDGSGGNFEVTITVGSQTVQPNPATFTFGTEVRSSLYTDIFPVKENEAVVVKAKSPNGADTDVDVTAYLYQVDAVDVVAVSGSSTAADNLEVVFDTDFATNYSTSNDMWSVDAVKVSGSSTAADNFEVVFDTDFATNYSASNDMWNVDAVKVSGSSTAADNFEIVFDTDFSTAYDATADMWNVDLAKIEGSATVDGETITNWYKYMLAYIKGEQDRSSNTVAYRNQADDATLWTSTWTATERNIS